MNDNGMSGNVTAVMHPQFSTMQGSLFLWQLVGFTTADAYAVYSNDVGHIDDFQSGGNGVLNATPGTANMQAGGVNNTLYAADMNSQSFYGNSSAYLADSSSQSATLQAHPQASTFDGNGFSMAVQQFSGVTFTSHNSSDVAYLDDNGASGASSYYSSSIDSYWQGVTPYKSYLNSAIGFTTTYSVPYNASDYAWIYDNAGGATLSYSNNAVVMGYGNGTTVSLVGFGAYNNPHVTANAAPPAGTHDYAQNAARPYVVFNGTWTYF